MKKMLITAISIAAFTMAHAQYKTVVPDINNPLLRSFQYQKNIFPRNSALQKTLALEWQKQFGEQPLASTKKNIDNMPIASSGDLILRYQQNNNSGFSIYQSSPDNMYIVKPDPGLVFTMPVVQ